MCAHVTYITLLLLETSFLPKASKRIFFSNGFYRSFWRHECPWGGEVKLEEPHMVLNW